MSHSSKLEDEGTLLPRSGARPGVAPRRRWLALASLGLAALALLAAGAALLGPTLRWAYNAERAGALIEDGLAWPEPRLSDSLPSVRDQTRLEAALDHLDSAIEARPDHPHAYRLAGQVHLARQDWPGAARAFERAQALAPGNPLPAWEASLAYEQMLLAIERAPDEPLLDLLAGGELAAPGQLIPSQFCRDGGASTCYFGQSAYSQAYADWPDGPQVAFPVLFLHPPATLSQPLQVPAATPLLRFVVGLDPVARPWRTDGATFRVLLTPQAGDQVVVAELAVDREAALRGWTRGWADLGPWAGQDVLLSLQTDPGPAGDPSDDWYGWGDLALTSQEARRYALLDPLQGLSRAWRAAGATAEAFASRGDEASAAGLPADAERWYRRAEQAALLLR